MVNISAFTNAGSDFSLEEKNIGDVSISDDGRLYAVTLNNVGKPCWTCLENDGNISAIIIALLKTIRWSSYYYRNHGDMFNRENTALQSVNVMPKRKKTQYNSHIGTVLKELAVSHPDMPRKERMRIAVDSWKTKSQLDVYQGMSPSPSDADIIDGIPNSTRVSFEENQQ